MSVIVSVDKHWIREYFQKIYILHWGHFSLFFLGNVLTILKVGMGLGPFLVFSLLCILYYLSFAYLKKLNYSYWAFSFFIATFYIINILNPPIPSTFFVFLCGGILLTIEMYSLFSPLYYPIVSWWEYDFRYRDDVKVLVYHDDEKVEGRLIDVRRGAGGICLFNDIPVGEKIVVETIESAKFFRIPGIIFSRRQYSIGRPKVYGIRFALENDADRNDFRNFCDNWNSDRRRRKKQKFIQGNGVD